MSPCPEGTEAESSEAKSEKEDHDPASHGQAEGEEGDEGDMTGVAEEGEEGGEGEEEVEGDRKKPVNETGKQVKPVLVRCVYTCQLVCCAFLTDHSRQMMIPFPSNRPHPPHVRSQ